MSKKTESVLERIKKPSELEAKTLAKMFSNSNPSGPRKRKFNPSDDCVASTSHVKKKRFKKHKKPKESSVTVILLKKFQPILPKGKERRELSAEGRIQTISVHRKMTAQEVGSIVQGAFKSMLKLKPFTVLETKGGSKLVRASYQRISGVEAVDRRGALYLMEGRESKEVNTFNTL